MNAQQLPDPITATEIVDNPELVPSSPILVQFSDGTLLHAYSGTAEASDGDDVPCAALEFRAPDGRLVSIVLDADGLFALAEVTDKLLSEVDPIEPGDEDDERAETV